MSKPAQMYDHELNPVKGWPSPYAVDKAAHVDLETGEVVNRGMVMSLNAAGNFQLGLACAAMPIFALNSNGDFDVVGDDGNLVGSGTGVSNMSGLVAVTALEVESTEFDTTEVYLPNQALTAGAPGAADAGVIKPGVFYTDTICGVVSDGAVINEFRKSVLRFWPIFLPALECPPVSSEQA